MSSWMCHRTAETMWASWQCMNSNLRYVRWWWVPCTVWKGRFWRGCFYSCCHLIQWEMSSSVKSSASNSCVHRVMHSTIHTYVCVIVLHFLFLWQIACICAMFNYITASVLVIKESSSTFSSGFTTTSPPLSPVWSTTVLHWDAVPLTSQEVPVPQPCCINIMLPHTLWLVVWQHQMPLAASIMIPPQRCCLYIAVGGTLLKIASIILTHKNQTMDLTVSEKTSQLLNQLIGLL